MLDKVSQMAEQVATNASRREFLGRFGRAALAAAAAVSGVLARPTIGDAAKSPACSSNWDCPTNKICSGGKCVKGLGPRV